MSSERDTTRIVRLWLEDGVNVLPDRVLESVLSKLPATPQRRPWWQAWRTRTMNDYLRLAAAGVAAVAVALVAGALLFRLPAVGPAASPSSGQTLSPSAVSSDSAPSAAVRTPSALPSAAAHSDAPFVVFIRMLEGEGLPKGHLWAMRTDGSDGRAIWPDSGSLINVAWSADGTRLLAVREYVIYLADVNADGIGPFVETGLNTGGDTACNEKSRRPLPCQDWAFTLAPDGEHVAFVQTCTYSLPGCGFITIMDLRTGERTELSQTLDQARRPLGLPAWSADGAQIAFVRETDNHVLGEGGIPESNLYIIGADGQNLRQIDVGGVRVSAPRWSPDGTTIAFMSDTWTDDGSHPERNIYTVRVDGTDVQALTTDGDSAWPEWTLSDQIRFTRGESYPDLGTFWLMDADGANAAELVDLRADIAALEPPGRVTNVWMPGNSFMFQPAP